jgi:hypothetical protein
MLVVGDHESPARSLSPPNAILIDLELTIRASHPNPSSFPLFPSVEKILPNTLPALGYPPFSLLRKSIPLGHGAMFLGDDFINGIVDLKVLVPIRYHQASGS